MSEYDSKYNVLDYRVKGDGVTDDTLAIQELINWIPSGSTLIFPIGRYLISDTLLFRDDLHYSGINWYSEILRSTDFTEGKEMINIKGQIYSEGIFHYFTVQNLTINGNKENTTEESSGEHGILLESASYGELKQVRVVNCKADGISTISVNGGRVNDIYINNCFVRYCNRYSILLHSGTGDTHIKNCEIGDNLKTNVRLEGPSNTLRGSAVWGPNSTYGIYVKGKLTHISDCQIEGNQGHQIVLQGASHSSITACRIYAPIFPGAYGIYLYNDFIENVLIATNNIHASIIDNGSWNSFNKAVMIQADHKNVTVISNSVKYLGVNEEVIEKRPYVSGLSTTKGDVWSEIQVNKYVKARLSSTTHVTKNTITPLLLTNILVDTAKQITEEGKIEVFEDGVYTIFGTISQSETPTSAYSVRISSNLSGFTDILKYGSTNEKSIAVMTSTFLEAGTYQLEFLITQADTTLLESTEFRISGKI